jgi:hypothetical protein
VVSLRSHWLATRSRVHLCSEENETTGIKMCSGSTRTKRGKDSEILQNIRRDFSDVCKLPSSHTVMNQVLSVNGGTVAIWKTDLVRDSAQ